MSGLRVALAVGSALVAVRLLSYAVEVWSPFPALFAAVAACCSASLFAKGVR